MALHSPLGKDMAAEDRPPQFDDQAAGAQRNHSVSESNKSFWQRIWPSLACGAGLFSDGYLNNVIGSVNTCLKRIYKAEYSNSTAQNNVTSITFVGTVIGMLIFGYTSDKWSRKGTLLVSTVILIIFAILGTGAYGAHGSPYGLFAALTAYRFFLGVGIGGEYPAGSVACAESTGELKSGTRNRWFIAFTNTTIDFGFLLGALMPMIFILITTEKHIRLAWRLMLGFGVIPPLSLLYLRIKLKEPEAFAQNSMKNTRTPYMLALRFYGVRLGIVSLLWFIYDFNSYSFSIYSTTILDDLLGESYPLWKDFGWNTLITLFYIPGAIAGMFFSDWYGPRKTLTAGVFVQAIVGFIMAGCYASLSAPKYVGAFVVVYGVFLALGEFGPGDNIGLLAAKTSASAIRGQYYGIAAAMGKIGAFAGTYAFGDLQDAAGSNKVAAGQNPFFISSALCVVAALLTWFFIPEIHQDTIDKEDVRFREYLESHGYDTSKMGLTQTGSEEALNVENTVPEKAS